MKNMPILGRRGERPGTRDLFKIMIFYLEHDGLSEPSSLLQVIKDMFRERGGLPL